MKEKKLKYPVKSGWYWVLIEGYDSPTPCWFDYNNRIPEDSFFLPAGLGDSSSTGLYLEDLEKIGPEIIEPKF